MNTDHEKFSAWLDDEAGAPLHYVADSDETYSKASRYRLIGEAMRGRVTEAAMIDVRKQVRAAIQHEAPAAADTAAGRPGFDPGGWIRDSLASLWKPVGGLAVAASVAMVMVVTLNQPVDEGGVATTAIVADSNPTLQPAPLAVPAASSPGAYYPDTQLAQPALVESPVPNRYVSQHSEFAAQDTVQGMMPYARAVSYGAHKKPDRQNTDQQQPRQ